MFVFSFMAAVKGQTRALKAMSEHRLYTRFWDALWYQIRALDKYRCCIQ